jgi:hypothetical protein
MSTDCASNSCRASRLVTHLRCRITVDCSAKTNECGLFGRRHAKHCPNLLGKHFHLGPNHSRMIGEVVLTSRGAEEPPPVRDGNASRHPGEDRS